jgi:hypothetical protein
MSKKYKNFSTGLSTLSLEKYSLGTSFDGKWGIIKFTKKSPGVGPVVYGGNNRYLVIKTTSEEKLKEILDLIYGCLVVFAGYDLYGFDFEDIYRVSDEKIHSFGDCSSPLGTNDIYPAGIMAARASFREKYVYAIQKLSFSMVTYSVPFIELDPRCGNLPLPTVKNPYPASIRVRMADAIINAYSSIEELGLDIKIKEEERESKGFLKEEKREKIVAELKNKKINIKEKVYWDKRGKNTIIDSKKRFAREENEKPEWYCPPHIRDEKIDLIDAIDRASFLRSCISSHKLSSQRGNRKKLIKILSPYDVINVQILARRLLLEKLKLWRVWIL